MSRGFNLDDYVPVADRIAAFWQAKPDGAIVTDAVSITDSLIVFRADVYADKDDERPTAVGWAKEVPATGKGVNATNALENAETSAIGRALANAGFSVSANRPSREEMQGVARHTPQTADEFAQSLGYHDQRELDAAIDDLKSAATDRLNDRGRAELKHYRESLDYAWPPTKVQMADLIAWIDERPNGDSSEAAPQRAMPASPTADDIADMPPEGEEPF